MKFYLLKGSEFNRAGDIFYAKHDYWTTITKKDHIQKMAKKAKTNIRKQIALDFNDILMYTTIDFNINEMLCMEESVA